MHHQGHETTEVSGDHFRSTGVKLWPAVSESHVLFGYKILSRFVKILYFSCLSVKFQLSDCIISINFDPHATSPDNVRGAILLACLSSYLSILIFAGSLSKPSIVDIVPAVTEAKISWTGSEKAKQFLLKYRALGTTTLWTELDFDANQEKQYILKNLRQNTEYEVNGIAECEALFTSLPLTFRDIPVIFYFLRGLCFPKCSGVIRVISFIP